MLSITIHIIISSLLATSIMTLFTYIIGIIAQKELGEPVYLNRLIRQSRRFEANTTDYHIIGFTIHYGIGVVFAAAMVAFRSVTGIQLSLWVGLGLGGILGLLGVIGWLAMFRLHHNPPKIELKVFLIQLVAAHVLFGFTVSLYFLFFNI